MIRLDKSETLGRIPINIYAKRLFILSTFFISFSTVVSASEINPQSAEIVDLASEHKIVSVGELYSDGNSKILCIELKNHQFSLLNIKSNKIYDQHLNKCDPPAGAHSLMTVVTADRNDKSPARGISRDMTFFPGGAISTNMRAAGNCSPPLDYSFSMKIPDGSYQEYYFIIRLRKEESFDLGSFCESSSSNRFPIKFKYAELEDLNSTLIDDTTVLLFSRDARAQEAVVLLMKRPPDKIWSSDDQIFIIPARFLAPQLQNAGTNIQKRYDALRELMPRK